MSTDFFLIYLAACFEEVIVKIIGFGLVLRMHVLVEVGSDSIFLKRTHIVDLFEEHLKSIAILGLPLSLLVGNDIPCLVLLLLELFLEASIIEAGHDETRQLSAVVPSGKNTCGPNLSGLAYAQSLPHAVQNGTGGLAMTPRVAMPGRLLVPGYGAGARDVAQRRAPSSLKSTVSRTAFATAGKMR